MVKTGGSRADKYAVKYDGRIMALRVKHWNNRAKANTQNPQFDLSLIATNLQEFFDTLSLKYGQRGDVTHLFNIIVQVYPTITAPQLESYHQRWLAVGLSEHQWELFIIELENKLVEIGHYFYRSSVTHSMVRTRVTVSGVILIQNYLIARKPTPLEYAEDMVKGDFQILAIPEPPHQTEENSGIRTSVVSNDIIDIVSPLFEEPLIEFSASGVNPLFQILFAFHIPVSIPAGFSDLLLCLPLNEGSGIAAHDISGKKNDGVLSSDDFWTTSGKYGNALNFNGSSDKVDCGINIRPTKRLTLSAWIKFNVPTGDGFQNDSVICKMSATPPYLIWKFGPESYDSKVTWQIRLDAMIGGNIWSMISTNVLPETWYHIVGVYDGRYARIYINGVLASGVWDWGIQGLDDFEEHVYIGYEIVNNRFFNGIIDEVRIYDRALNAAEVASLYESNVPPMIYAQTHAENNASPSIQSSVVVT